jgi:hypothetical protein
MELVSRGGYVFMRWTLKRAVGKTELVSNNVLNYKVSQNRTNIAF